MANHSRWLHVANSIALSGVCCVERPAAKAQERDTTRTTQWMVIIKVAEHDVPQYC